MSDQTKQAILDLALKGFLPLLMVAAVLYGGYALFDRLIDLQEDTLNRIFQEIVHEQKRAATKLDTISDNQIKTLARQDSLVPLIEQLMDVKNLQVLTMPAGRDKTTLP